MLAVLPALVMAPLLVGCSTLVAWRWGDAVGGLVSAFPAVVGPVLIITAQLQGVGSAARAADGTLLGLAGLSAFAVAYARAAWRTGWRASLVTGWLAAAVVTAGVGWLAGEARFPASAAIAVAALWAGYLATPSAARSPTQPARRRRARADVPLRMAVTLALVGLLALATAELGPLVGGLLAGLPALASVLAAFTHHRDGAAAVAMLLRGMLSGLVGFVSFCAVFAVLAVPAGAVPAFTVASLSAVGLQAAALVSQRRAWIDPQPVTPGA